MTTTSTEIPTTGGTTHTELAAWVEEVAALTTPDQIVWCDGSEEEWNRLTQDLVDAGTFVKLDKKPNSFWAASDPADVARVEDRTFICTETAEGAGPTNHWMAPDEMKSVMTDLYRGCMKGRTMFVIPFVMGHLESDTPMYGVEITDSEYVVCSMRIMARIGTPILQKMEETNASFVKCLHSVGMPLAEGQKDVAWPCSETKYISHFPEERTIWSYGSGYGGNALLGKKCYALRIASAMAHDEGWMAEHMLILKLTSPEGKVHYIAAAFPSACGKTNLAMLEPTIPGWKAEMIGDDIAWMRFRDGKLYAVNPENGLFGVAPGTGYSTNENAMHAIEKGNSIFTNVARTLDGDVWWEGMTDEEPEELIDWHGNKWTPESENKAAHPNSRFCTPIKQCPVTAAEADDPNGVPISAILFGGRRKTTVPLVTEARDWNHGTFIGSTVSSETTAAAAGAVGVVRRDPMAMLPFIGYNAGDYLQHWIDMGTKGGDKMPSVFLVNWFRRGDDGRFLWPGFGENSRVLKWIIDRIEGRVGATETVVGHTAKVEDIDLTGLDTPVADVEEALTAPAEQWEGDLADNEAWLEKLGPKVPAEVHEQFAALKKRIADAK